MTHSKGLSLIAQYDTFLHAAGVAYETRTSWRHGRLFFCMVISMGLYLVLVLSRELYNVRNIGAYELDEVLAKLIAHLVERSG